MLLEEIYQLSRVNSVLDFELKCITIGFPCLHPACHQSDPHHVQMVRQSHVITRDVSLLQCVPPPPKWKELALLVERITVELTPRCFLKESKGMVYNAELFHGCDCWLVIISIAYQFVALLQFGKRWHAL